MAVRRVADDGSAVWPMAARRRADAGKHYGATAICIFEFASRIAAFWLVGAREKHEERLGKFAGRTVRKARQADCLESSPSGSFKKLIKRIAGASYRGVLQVIGLIWQKTPLGGLVARLGFWVL